MLQRPDRYSLAQTVSGMTVAPVSSPLALRPEAALTTASLPLDTYQALTRGFARASRDVGTYGGTPIVGRSDAHYVVRLMGAGTAGWAALSLVVTGVVDALSTTIAVSLVPAAVCTGVAFCVSGLAGRLMAKDGAFKRQRTQEVEKLRHARAQKPLDPELLAFARRRFNAAHPTERALIGAMAERWLRQLDQRQIIGKNARDVLRGIVAEAAMLPAELTSSGSRIAEVAETIFGDEGEVYNQISMDAARRILRACDKLTDDEHAALLEPMRTLLFDGERPRVTMQFEACQALLEGLAARKKET